MAYKPLNILDLPNELLEKIVYFCPLSSFYSLSATCKSFNGIVRSDHIWKLKWKYLITSSNLKLDDPSKEMEYENYYHCSQRLLRVCYRPGIGIMPLPGEHTCNVSGCSSKCKESEEKKFAFDVGSKITWIMTSGYFLERHPSVLVIPACDLNCRKLSDKYDLNSSTCNTKRINCLLCQHDDVKRKKNLLGPQLLRTEQLQLGFGLEEEPNEESNSASSNSNRASSSGIPLPITSIPLMQPKFTLWSEISFMLRDAKINHEIFHPAQCFFGTEDFCYLEQYLWHLILKLNMTDDVKKANSSLVFCEPYNCTMETRQRLSKFFIEFLQVKKICFMNKSLATALLFGIGTCIVIDSGARNTVVTVVIDGVVQNCRTQHCPIGGTEIAQYLADAIKMNGLKNDVYVPSLDSDRVKSRCFLALNPNFEERRGNSTKRKVFVRCMKEGPGPHLEEIRLGSELFLAPEIMYTAMDVVNKMKSALEGLEPSLVKEILSHVILTGSNTELKGFSTRLARDLQAAFPQHCHSIFLKSSSGSHSWDAVTGAMYVPILYGEISRLTECFSPPKKPTPGSLLWVTREEYILKGPSLFVSVN